MSEASDGSPNTPEPVPVQPPDPGTGDSPAWVPADVDLDVRPRIPLGKIVTGALSLLLVAVVLALALPWASGASWSQILTTLAATPAWALPAVTLLGLGAIALEALTVRTAVAGSRYTSALLGHTASSGLGLALPGGSVLGLGLLGWIMRRAGLAVPVILTGIIAASLVEMVITSLLVPLVGLGAYAAGSATGLAGVSLPGAITAAVIALLGAVIALALLTILLRRPVLARIITRLGDLVPERIATTVFVQRDALVTMLRRRPIALLAPTCAARILQWAALLLAIRAVGAEVPLLLTVAVFALGRLIALVPITPGGAGISETVGAAALVALGVGAADAAAAMLLMLVTSLVVPLLAGTVSTVMAFMLPEAARAGD